MSPTGMAQNFLVVMLSYGSVLLNTIFAGMYDMSLSSDESATYSCRIVLTTRPDFQVYCSHVMSHPSLTLPLVITLSLVTSMACPVYR